MREDIKADAGSIARERITVVVDVPVVWEAHIAWNIKLSQRKNFVRDRKHGVRSLKQRGSG